MKNIPFEIEQFIAKNLCLKSYINLLNEILFWNEISKIYIDARMLNEAIDLILWVEEVRVTNKLED
nr:MAG TPA: hypothetical protein [Caudoviricetes sp.]